MNHSSIRPVLATLLLLVVAVSSVTAQDEVPQFNFGKGLGLDPGGAAIGDGPVVTIKASYVLRDGSQDGTVTVTAHIEEGWNIYSTTQAAGGPLPSTLTLAGVDGAKITAIPRPDKPPKGEVDNDLYPGITQEKHFEKVVWTAPITVPKGFDPKSAKLQVEFNGLACSSSCIPQEASAVATYKGPDKRALRSPDYQGKLIHASVQGQLDRAAAKPGEQIVFSMTAKVGPEYHVYKYEPKAIMGEDATKLGYYPTYIAVDAPARWSVAAAQTDAKLINHIDKNGKTLPYYEGEVTWQLPIQIPKDASPGRYHLKGFAVYQTCTKDFCDPPHDVQFDLFVEVGETARSAGAVPVLFGKGKSGTTQKLVAQLAGTASGPAAVTPNAARTAKPDGVGVKLADLKGKDLDYSFGVVFGLAFLGGLILNVMPCVLPVIGLKIMSFVNQAGQDRKKILTLNAVYAAGIITIFLLLATLTVVAGYGWGDQNSSVAFKITAIAVVFAMGLSFVGVWEIPIPGFVGSGKMANAAEKEGLVGAYIKGNITTILAVPCTGPFMGSALAWCLGKPTIFTFFIFFGLGLGMASPYLLIGAFPKLIRFLPKPGAWMETFKQVMGFSMLATIVWFFTFLDWPQVIPTFGFLIALWFACWWIGKLPFTMPRQSKVKHWAAAAFVPALVGIYMFSSFEDKMVERFNRAAENRATEIQKELALLQSAPDQNKDESKLPWQDFSRARIDEELARGRTIMVDFTAEWCPTCKYLEHAVLNTKEVKDVVEKNDVATFLADYTHFPDDIRETLDQFRGKSLPFLLIIPADSPSDPIVAHGPYSKAKLIRMLGEAGPSKTAGTNEAGEPVAVK